MYCPKCGNLMKAGDRFCAACGADTARPAATRATSSASSAAGQFSVVLGSLGTADVNTACALLMEICGYTQQEALLMINSAPVTIAQYLSSQQAAYLAQALNEYGMDTTVYDGTSYCQTTTGIDTLYDSNGAFLAGAASVLGMLGMSNRIAREAMHRHPPIPPVAMRRGAVFTTRNMPPRPMPSRNMPPRPLVVHEPGPRARPRPMNNNDPLDLFGFGPGPRGPRGGGRR